MITNEPEIYFGPEPSMLVFATVHANINSKAGLFAHENTPQVRHKANCLFFPHLSSPL